MNLKRCKRLRKIAQRLAAGRTITMYTKKETIKYGIGIDAEGKLAMVPYVRVTLLVDNTCQRGIYRNLKRTRRGHE